MGKPTRPAGETSGGNEYCARARHTNKERGGEKERRTGPRRAWIYADVGWEREAPGATESERTKGQGRGSRERLREKTRKREGEANDATVRARMTEGTTLEGATRTSDSARATVRESEVAGGEGWPITCVGEQGGATGTEARRMRGGRGNARLCPDNPSSSLSRRRPFYFRLARATSRPFPRPFEGLALSFFHRFVPLDRAIEGVRSLPLYCRRDAPASLADHGRVRTIQGPAGARCYSFRGAQYLGDRQCK